MTLARDVVRPPALALPSPSSPDGGPDFDAAAAYVTRVKRRLGENSYACFIEILQWYHGVKSKQAASASTCMLLDAALVLEVNEQIAVLFALHPDLLEGFRAFLPEAAMVPSPLGTNQVLAGCASIARGLM